MDPQNVREAFKLAYAVSAPAYRTAIREAYADWTETAASGAVAGSFGAAVGCACRAGVGTVFVGAAVEVVADQLIAEAEANLGRPLTPYEQQAVRISVASAEAGENPNDPNSSWAYYVKNYTPQGVAYQLGVEAGERVLRAMEEAKRIAEEEAKAAQDALINLRDATYDEARRQRNRLLMGIAGAFILGAALIAAGRSKT